MRILVTGCAGFIGSNLVDSLTSLGHYVVGIDNLKTGVLSNLKEAMQKTNFEFVQIDLLTDNYGHAFNNIDMVYHLAANADVRFGPDNPEIDFQQNTVVTQKLLENIRKHGIKKIVFSSTGSVYGEAKLIPTPEDVLFPIQTSLYGASKLACEGLIQAYSEAFQIEAWIFRFVSILGQRYSHGHIIDFYHQLLKDSSTLKVLGDGNQRKSYLHVNDCIEALNIPLTNISPGINIYNLGTDESCTVKDSISWILNELDFNPRIDFGVGNKGWIGDNPYIQLDTQRIKELDWQPKNTIEQSVRNTVQFLSKKDSLT